MTMLQEGFEAEAPLQVRKSSRICARAFHNSFTHILGYQLEFVCAMVGIFHCNARCVLPRQGSRTTKDGRNCRNLAQDHVRMSSRAFPLRSYKPQNVGTISRLQGPKQAVQTLRAVGFIFQYRCSAFKAAVTVAPKPQLEMAAFSKT